MCARSQRQWLTCQLLVTGIAVVPEKAASSAQRQCKADVGDRLQQEVHELSAIMGLA